MFHGWKVVGCAFLIAVFGWGFGFYGIGVFLAELVERHGWPTRSVASAVTVLYLAGAILIAQAGSVFERLAKDDDNVDSVRRAEESGCILVEDRAFLERV